MTINDSLVNATNLREVAVGANAATDGAFWGLIVLAIAIVIFIVGIHDNEFSTVFLADTFICLLLLAGLYAFQLVSGVVVGFVFASFVFAVILKRWGG
jgi:hypothetical protein